MTLCPVAEMTVIVMNISPYSDQNIYYTYVYLYSKPIFIFFPSTKSLRIVNFR